MHLEHLIESLFVPSKVVQYYWMHYQFVQSYFSNSLLNTHLNPSLWANSGKEEALFILFVSLDLYLAGHACLHVESTPSHGST